MIKYIYIVLVFAILLSSCSSKESVKELNETDYFNVINKEFTGDLAYETTSFVEKYWRVVGNTGFDASIYFIAEKLDKMGYVKEEEATAKDLLTYRIETRPLKRPTWESVNASVIINGDKESLLELATNTNMIAMNSYSTPKEGVRAEVVYIKDLKNIKEIDVKDKIVFVETSPGKVFNTMMEEGAVGVLSYNMPSYLQPKKNTTSIQFRSIPLNEEAKGWAIALSYSAKERLKDNLKKGKVFVKVVVETKIYPSEELTIVADIKGAVLPKERLVFSAHIQEPGANDNASGVGVALEMASVVAKHVKDGSFIPKRTLTFLWGDEIISTRRYVQEDSIRAQDIKWGISLDMVGENTEKTGGVFLIEKMPDPSAIWTRGNDKHTEWGGSKMKLDQMKPHYLNDFLIDKFIEQGKRVNWKVSTNPFEGGSDHVPFLGADIPSVLFWHFTDQFYHTDNDRIDKVSQTTLKNVGITALVSAFVLINSDENTGKSIIKGIEVSAIIRLNEELKQSKIALNKGEDLEIQIKIISAWEDWYLKAISSTNDMVDDISKLEFEMKNAQNSIKNLSEKIKDELRKIDR